MSPIAIKTENNENATDGWNRPATPLPATTYAEPDHTRLHWSFCTNDGCPTHYSSKIDNNYWPKPTRARNTNNRRQKKPCQCTEPHDPSLDQAIREKHLDPRRACNGWKNGKRRCDACGYIVNLTGHEARCGNPAAPVQVEDTPAGQEESPQPLADITEEETPTTNENTPTVLIASLQRSIRTANRSQEAAAVGLALAHQMLNEQRTQVHQTLQRENAAGLARLEDMVRQARSAQRCCHHRTVPGRRRRVQRPHRLAGASAWRGGLLSRISPGPLILVTSILTTAGLWVTLVTCVCIRSLVA
jgi:hypothetical protein